MPTITVKDEYHGLPAYYRALWVRRAKLGLLAGALLGTGLLVGAYWGYSAAWAALQATCICLGH
jgi:hypothetical protein